MNRARWKREEKLPGMGGEFYFIVRPFILMAVVEAVGCWGALPNKAPYPYILAHAHTLCRNIAFSIYLVYGHSGSFAPPSGLLAFRSNVELPINVVFEHVLPGVQDIKRAGGA